MVNKAGKKKKAAGRAAERGAEPRSQPLSMASDEYVGVEVEVEKEAQRAVPGEVMREEPPVTMDAAAFKVRVHCFDETTLKHVKVAADRIHFYQAAGVAPIRWDGLDPDGIEGEDTYVFRDPEGWRLAVQVQQDGHQRASRGPLVQFDRHGDLTEIVQIDYPVASSTGRLGTIVVVISESCAGQRGAFKPAANVTVTATAVQTMQEDTEGPALRVSAKSTENGSARLTKLPIDQLYLIELTVDNAGAPAYSPLYAQLTGDFMEIPVCMEPCGAVQKYSLIFVDQSCPSRRIANRAIMINGVPYRTDEDGHVAVLADGLKALEISGQDMEFSPPEITVDASAAAAFVIQTTVSMYKPKSASWTDVEILDENNKPVAYHAVDIKSPDGRTAQGRTDSMGIVKVPTGCTISVPADDPTFASGPILISSQDSNTELSAN
jgi:hypothetical protein